MDDFFKESIIPSDVYICHYLYSVWESARKDPKNIHIRKKKKWKNDGKHIDPVCKLLPTSFLVHSHPALSAYIRTSFHGDKHQKLLRKLNTCALFLFIFFPSSPSHVPTRPLSIRAVPHTLNNIREIRCFPFYFHFLTVIRTLIGRYMYYTYRRWCQGACKTSYRTRTERQVYANYI